MVPSFCVHSDALQSGMPPPSLPPGSARNLWGGYSMTDIPKRVSGVLRPSWRHECPIAPDRTGAGAPQNGSGSICQQITWNRNALREFLIAPGAARVDGETFGEAIEAHWQARASRSDCQKRLKNKKTT